MLLFRNVSKIFRCLKKLPAGSRDTGAGDLAEMAQPARCLQKVEWLCPSPHGLSHHSNTPWQRQETTNLLLTPWTHPCFAKGSGLLLPLVLLLVGSPRWIRGTWESKGLQHKAGNNPLTEHSNGSRCQRARCVYSLSWAMFSKASENCPSHWEIMDLTYTPTAPGGEQMRAEASSSVHLTCSWVSALSSSPNSYDSPLFWTHSHLLRHCPSPGELLVAWPFPEDTWQLHLFYSTKSIKLGGLPQSAVPGEAGHFPGAPKTLLQAPFCPFPHALTSVLPDTPHPPRRWPEALASAAAGEP